MCRVFTGRTVSLTTPSLHSSSSYLRQLLLLRLPFLDAVGDVYGDALGAEVSATDVAGDWHDGGVEESAVCVE